MASVKKHIAKDGTVTYYIRSFDGRDINGKQIEKTMKWSPEPGMTERQIEKEIERLKVLFDEKVKKGFVLDGSTKFADYAEKWLDNNRPPQLAPKTYERYVSLLKNINTAIGHIKLEKLQSHHLQAFYKQLATNGSKCTTTKAVARVDLTEVMNSKKLTRTAIASMGDIAPATVTTACKGNKITLDSAAAIAKALDEKVETLFKIEREESALSDKTILHHHRLISSILGQATRERIIPFNVADRQYMKAPKVEPKEARFLDNEQAQQVVDKALGEPIKWRTALLTLLYTGLRRGELMGLEWKDIDFKNKMIHVRRTSQYVSGMGIICKEPKNKTSVRSIKVTDDIMGLLSEYRKWWISERFKLMNKMEKPWNDYIDIKDSKGNIERRKNDRLFVQEDGLPMNPDSLTDWTEKFITRHNLPKITPHGLRHTNITLQIFNQVPIRVVASRAGHATPATTNKIYAHVIQEADERAAEVISNALGLKLVKDNHKIG